MSTASGTASAALAVVESAERARVRELQQQLNGLRDRIAALELELETLRDELARMDLRYRIRLSPENALLARIASLIHYLERWTDLLEEASRQPIAARARRVEARRAREAKKLFEEREQPPPRPEPPAAPPKKDESLKSLYRSLARRFHPDLATTEEERVRFGERMTRINLLYQAGDFEGLRRMAEQMLPEAEPASGESAGEQLKQLEEKLAWFETVLANLGEEKQALEHSPTWALWQKVQEGADAGRDVLEEIANELREQARRARHDVRAAVLRLEKRVSEYNRRGAGLARQDGEQGSGALERIFDPYANRRMIRLGVEALAQASFSPGARRQAEWIEGLAQTNPALLRLVLLAYASERCEHPPPGLETYEGLSQRFAYLRRNEEPSASLEETLVEGADLLEYGVLRATGRSARAGLRFRSESVREGTPLAVRAPAVRRELRQVLGVLGKRVTCKHCGHEVFEVPLYRLRGLDDLHASVCPDCCATLESYWMPTGKNVQSELNDAFLDLELVSESTFRFGRASVAIQLLPKQAEELTVGGLKQRFHQDVLARHGLGVEPGQVYLTRGRKRLDEDVLLADLDEPSFGLSFTREAPVTVANAVEIVRHRIRHRFRRDAPPDPSPPRA